MNINKQQDTAPLKVLFVTHNYIRYVGDFAGVFLHLLAKKLLEKNIQIYVVAPHDAGLAEYEEIQGIKIYRFKYASNESETFAYRGDMHNQLFKNPFKIFRLKKFLNESFKLASKVIKEENIEIVSVQWLIPNGYVAKKLKYEFGDKIKLFLSSHGSDIRILSKFKLAYSLVRSAVKRCEAYTVVSNHLREQLIALDNSISDKIKVIPLPNDETIFYPDKNIPEDSNLVVAVSRLTVQKRLKYLIDAVNIAKKDVEQIKLDIYGSGPEKETLQKQVSNLGLDTCVRFLEPVPQRDLKNIYNRAAVVVLNSYREGFGLALTEAMLCGTAVIGTNSGGITDIIEDNETGLLVPPDKEGKLAEALIKILKDHSLRKKLAKAGYEKAKANFSSESSARNFAELYKGIL